MKLVFIPTTLLLLTAWACQPGPKPKQDHEHHAAAPASAMEAEYEQHQAAPAPATAATAHEPTTLMFNDTQAQLANLTTQPVALGVMGPSIVANGRLMANPQHSEVISSRAAGRIEKLHVKETGRRVRQGEPLYELYSEMLLTLQQEYLAARAQAGLAPRYASLAAAAEKKLLRYGMTPAQVAQLAQQKAASAHITFLAPASGLVTAAQATEGQYVDEGSLLYRLEDISTLWAEGELYPAEAQQVARGSAVSIRIDGTTEAVAGQVIFIAPQYRDGSQVTVARVLLNNAGGRLMPGMQAQMTFLPPGPGKLTVPLNAVIRDAHGAHVYVQTAPHTYQPRAVRIGAEDAEQVEILQGLVEKEVIVATGAYLLYSEIILKKGVQPLAHQCR